MTEGDGDRAAAKKPKSSAKTPNDATRADDATRGVVEHSADEVHAKQPFPTLKLPPLSRILSIVMLLLGIIVVGALFFQVMVGFFVPLFLAALLVVIFRPVHIWILKRTRFRRRLASSLTTTLILVVVLMPVITVLSVAASQFTSAISQTDFDSLSDSLDSAKQRLGLALEHPEMFRRLDLLADRMDSANVDSADNESAEQEVADLDLIADFSKLLARITEARSLVVYLDHSVRGVDVSAAEDDPDSAVIESEGFEERSDALSPAETTSPGETTSPADTTADPDPESSADFSVAESGDEESSVDESSAATTPLPATKEELVNDERWTKYLSADASNAVKQLDVLAETVRNYRSGVRNGPFGRIVSEEKYHRESVRASALIRTWMRESLGGTLWSQLRLIANPGAQDYRNLLQRGRETLQPRFVSLTSRTGSYVLQIGVGLVVMVIAVYFFLVDGSRMTRTLMRLSPLDDNYEEQLLNEFDRTSRAVVLASVSSALVQGLLAAIAYYFLGFNSVILLFLLTSLMALVPFLGAASVWVPCVLYLLAVEERIGAAVFLGIYGMTAISSIDNVIKVYVLQGRSTLHPLFALLSVLGGVTVFGPIGIIVGPMVVVFLQTLLEILNHELMQEEPA